jgi:hypothetical protein
MKLSELSEGQAIAVEAKGTIQLNDGDFVLVGVKCVYKDGKFVPLPKRIKMIPDIFDDIKGDELVVIKRFTLLKIHN